MREREKVNYSGVNCPQIIFSNVQERTTMKGNTISYSYTVGTYHYKGEHHADEEEAEPVD